MRIAAAITLALASLHFAAAPEIAEARAVVRGNNCFSGVSSDEADAKEECGRAGFTCTAPLVMSCYFDNGRHMYICQCKNPPKNPRAVIGDDNRRQQTRPAPGSEYQPQPEPQSGEDPPPQEEPQLLAASAHTC